MKRFLALFTTFLLACLFSVYASAEEFQKLPEYNIQNPEDKVIDTSMISLRYTYISAISAALSIVGDTAYCNGNIQTNASGVTTSVAVQLQRSANGTSWSTIKTWSGSGTYSADVTGQQSISSGYQYRVSVNGKVLDQSGKSLESATKYSEVKTH